jgi:hypothetical protein
MPAFTKDNSVLCDGVLLPKFLFYFDNIKSKSVSPVARFNPVSAFSGQAFQSSISPSKIPQKKTIIIDRNSLTNLPDYGERIALLKRLKIAGFEIFLLSPTKENPRCFHKVDDNLSNISRLQNLAIFNEETDYAELSKAGVARDKALVMKKEKYHVDEVVQALEQGAFHTAHVAGDNLRCQLQNLDFEVPKFSQLGISFIETKSVKESLKFISTRIDSEDFIIRLLKVGSISDENKLLFLSLLPQHRKNFHIEKTRFFAEKINEFYVKFAYRYDTAPFENIRFLVEIFPESRDEIFNLVSSSLSRLPKRGEDSYRSQGYCEHFVNLCDVFAERKKELIATFKSIFQSPKYFEKLNQSESQREQIKKQELEQFLKEKKRENEMQGVKISSDDEILKKGEENLKYRESRENNETMTEGILLGIYGENPEQFLEKIHKLIANQNPSQELFLLIKAAAHNEILSKELFDVFFFKCLERGISINDKPGRENLFKELILLSQRVPRHVVSSIFEGSDYSLEVIGILSNLSPIMLNKARNLVSTELTIRRGSNLVLFHLPSELINKALNHLPELRTKGTIRLNFAMTEFSQKKFSYSFALPGKKPTYLDLSDIAGKFDCNGLISENFKYFSDVAVVRFPYKGSLDYCQTILKNFISEKGNLQSSIKYLIFPKSLEKNKEELRKICQGVAIEFSDYQLAEFETYLQNLKNLKRHEGNIELEKDDLPLDYPKRKDRKIRIAIGDSERKLDVTTTADQVYVMASSGEVLNSDDQFYVRGSVVKRKITEDLNQEEYFPTSESQLRKVENLRALTEEEIERLKSKAESEVYYKFEQRLKAGEKFRLLSVDAAEEFVGILGDVAGITIERGDDDFLYATSATDRDLTYVIKALNPKSHEAAYDRLSPDNPMKKIIDDYRDPKQGYVEIAKGEKKKVHYDPAKHEDSMVRMFNERSGVCRHRVAAVEFMLTKSGISPDNFRSVSVNGNHVVLEIRSDDGSWIQVDVGGGEGKEKEGKDSSKGYVAKPVRVSAKKVEDEKKLAENRVASVLAASSKLKKVLTENALKAETTDNAQNKVLVVTRDFASHANFFTRQAVAQNRDVYLLDDAKKNDLFGTKIAIANDNFARLKVEGMLSAFLAKAIMAPEGKRPLLIINWDAFSNHEKVALNTVLDRERKIGGKDIPQNVQIIVISSTVSKDPSFRSRISGIESEVNISNEQFEKAEKERVDNLGRPVAEPIAEVIDFQGFQNWQECLFGKVAQKGDKMPWQPSKFVNALKAGKVNFEVANLSKKSAEELKKEIEKAKAAGKFIYQEHEIPCPPNLKVTFAKLEFNFAKFQDKSKVEVRKNVTFNQAPQDSKLINQNLFDLLLYENSITQDGLYIENPGLIEKASKTTDKTLKLFISSELSVEQWYCLFNEAQNHNVKLELHLAPQVTLPDRFMAFSESVILESQNQKQKEDVKAAAQVNSKIAKIIVTNDPKRFVAPFIALGSENAFAAIDVEDQTYQDLVERTEFRADTSGFKDFKKIESYLLTQLKAGKRIILRGNFPADLLQMLEPIITCQAPFEEAGKNLILVVEDKECQEGQVYKPLKWLPQTAYEVAKFAPQVLATAMPFSEVPDKSYDLKDSERKAAQFIENRKKAFVGVLKENSMLRLVGHSGVGKSRLLKEFETHDQATTKIYREFDAFATWANDKSRKEKILFIDESNIEDSHLTVFSPLKKDGNRRVFYKGKFYDLDENHKVVFACNPVEYGGGRLVQKLFEDGEIPAIELRDFPASYIYEKILKETIYQKLAPQVKKEISEEDFRKICEPLIAEYQKLNGNKKDKEANQETVRELQEKVLIAIDKKIDPPKPQKIITANFVSTDATKDAEAALNQFLNISVKQREGVFSAESVGLNAIIFEGSPGCGKSEMIKAILTDRRLIEKTIKVDANWPRDKKLEAISKARKNKCLLWIDELNSCIDDGLEKEINAALTDSGAPGFRIISSINSAALEGRSVLSPAIIHRSTMVKVKSPQEYAQKDVAEIVRGWGVAQKQQEIANDFVESLKLEAGKNFNFRMLREKMSEISLQYQMPSSRPNPMSPESFKLAKEEIEKERAKV